MYLHLSLYGRTVKKAIKCDRKVGSEAAIISISVTVKACLFCRKGMVSSLRLFRL